VFVCVIYLLTLNNYYGWISDGVEMFETAASLHEFGELKIPNAGGVASASLAEPEGYSKYGLGLPLILQIPLSLTPSVERLWGQGRSNLLFSLTMMLITALTVLLVALCLRDLDLGLKVQLLGAVAFAFGTMAWPYTSYDFSEPLQALTLLASFWLLLRAFNRASYVSSRATDRVAWTFRLHDEGLLMLAGLALGFAVLTKALLLVTIPAYVLYLCVRSEPKRRLANLFWLFVPLAAWAIAIGWLNHYRFGSVFDFGYGNESRQFTTPLLTGLYGLLLSPNRGLLFYAPVSFLAPCAVWRFRKRFCPELAFFVLIFFLVLLPTATWWSWEGGVSWGPRLLMPIIPFLVIAASLLLEDQGRFVPAYIGMVIAGIMVNVLGVLIFFGAWTNVLSFYRVRVPIDQQGRPSSEYVEQAGHRWFYPFVAVNFVPELSPILGHVQLLRLRYFGTPFSVDVLNNPALPREAGASFEQLVINRALIEKSQPPTLRWLVFSSHFWFWDLLLRKPRYDDPPVSQISLYATALKEEGDRSLARTDLERAKICYQKSLDLTSESPESVTTVIFRAQILASLGQLREAEQELVRSLEKGPREASVRLSLAQVYELQGQTENALRQYELFLSDNRDDARVSKVRERIAEISARTAK
jgi:hypothetical protein